MFLRCLFLLFFLPQIAVSADLNQLGNSPEWLALGHYHLTSFGRESYVYSKEFFLNENGRFDPQAELQSTYEKFIAAEPESICRFPARFYFLVKKFPELENVKVACPEFSEWFSNINPQSLTLIFPASFINNPASAFGHTLLRINQPGQDENSSLIAYSANFSAQTYGENALLYAFKGVFGGYAGRFAVAPYYKLVKKYSDMESRDIYEYDLDFTDQETYQLIRHLWELRNTDFTYYYFDENCSFHLLGLFDLLRPELKLRESFDAWAIPGDTLKEILERQLVTKKTFRPSLVSKLNAGISATPKDSTLLAKELTKRKLMPADVEDAAALDLSYDYLEYLAFRKGIEDRDYSLRLLTQRSSIKAPPIEARPKASFPEEAHASQRLMLHAGIEDKDFYNKLSYRGSYHYLDDPQAGFMPGSGIELIEGQLKFKNDQVKLNNLKIINIASITPQNEFLKPLSWKLYTGFKRGDSPEAEDKLYSQNSLLFGGAEFFEQEKFWYFLPGATLNLNSHYQSEYSLGPAANIGIYQGLSEKLNFRTDLFITRQLAGEMHSEVSYQAAFTYDLNKALRLEFAFNRDKTWSKYASEFELGLKYYY